MSAATVEEEEAPFSSERKSEGPQDIGVRKRRLDVSESRAVETPDNDTSDEDELSMSGVSFISD